MTTTSDRAEIEAFIASGRATVIPAVPNAQDRIVELHLAGSKRGFHERNRENNARYWTARKAERAAKGKRA